MDNVTETVKATPQESLGFFKYVFNFDEDNKCEMLNVLQYSALAIIPVLLILKAVKHLIPEEDESKGSLEILAESLGQVALMLILIWFSDKIIRYVPTYSGCQYSKFVPTNFMLPFLIILATMHTKLGAKLNILIDRMIDMWHGRGEAPPQQTQGQGHAQGQGTVRVSQPIAGQHQPSQADYLDTNQLLPSNRQLTSMPAPQMQSGAQVAPQQSPDFNQMYQNTTTPMPGAAVPGDTMEPMAANEAFGGMFGGSSW